VIVGAGEISGSNTEPMSCTNGGKLVASVNPHAVEMRIGVGRAFERTKPGLVAMPYSARI